MTGPRSSLRVLSTLAAALLGYTAVGLIEMVRMNHLTALDPNAPDMLMYLPIAGVVLGLGLAQLFWTGRVNRSTPVRVAKHLALAALALTTATLGLQFLFYGFLLMAAAGVLVVPAASILWMALLRRDARTDGLVAIRR
jgi:hypothetical protein